jgi:small subunit ribosomal protein S9
VAKKQPPEKRPPDEQPAEAAPEAEAPDEQSADVAPEAEAGAAPEADVEAEQPAADEATKEQAPEPAEAQAEAEAEAAPVPEAEAPDKQPGAQEPGPEEPDAQEPDAQPAAEKAPEASPQKAAPAEAPTARARPEVPGADLEVDIVPEGADPLGAGALGDDALGTAYAEDVAPVVEEPEPAAIEEEEEVPAPITAAAIDLAAGARYRATGKRKTAIARVILRPGKGAYTINGRKLEEHFPRPTLQRNIRQPLETVGYEERMDVVARLHGGGISAQAGALRHGISRALLEADPNLRGELKRRGFLTRDARAKERKKAGLKKARKRPQFSKR